MESQTVTHPTIILATPASRQLAASWCMKAPDGAVATFRESRRSIPQNARLHAMLTDVASQATYHGVKMSVDDWKRVFAAALKRELRTVPSLDGSSIVILAPRTSTMTKPELGDLMALVEAWGAENGVEFSEPKAEANAA